MTLLITQIIDCLMGSRIKCHDRTIAKVANKQLAAVDAKTLGSECHAPRGIQQAAIIPGVQQSTRRVELDQSPQACATDLFPAENLSGSLGIFLCLGVGHKQVRSIRTCQRLNIERGVVTGLGRCGSGERVCKSSRCIYFGESTVESLYARVGAKICEVDAVVVRA